MIIVAKESIAWMIGGLCLMAVSLFLIIKTTFPINPDGSCGSVKGFVLTEENKHNTDIYMVLSVIVRIL